MSQFVVNIAHTFSGLQIYTKKQMCKRMMTFFTHFGQIFFTLKKLISRGRWDSINSEFFSKSQANFRPKILKADIRCNLFSSIQL